MTQSPSMLELAAACERADESDREIDAEVFLLTIKPDWRAAKDWKRTNGWFKPGCAADAVSYYTPDGLGRSKTAPPYTASIDAAMSLVPKGFCVSAMGEVPDDCQFYVCLWGEYESEGEPELRAKTLPLALCAAALRAHPTQGSKP